MWLRPTGGAMSEKSFPVPSRAERRRAARCKPVNRQQLLLRSVDVAELVEEDHCVRAIWELVDRGVIGFLGFGPAGADQSLDLCVQSGGEFGAGDFASVRVRPGLSVVDRP